MIQASDTFLLCLSVAIPLLGIASVVTARLCEHGASQTVAQGFFLFSLLVVGATTLIAIAMGTGLGVLFGATLCLMAIGATLDLRQNPAFSTV